MFLKARSLVAIYLAIAGAGCNAHDTAPHATEKGHMHGPVAHMHLVPPNADDYEKDFLHQMSDHHASEIALSGLAIEKEVHPELKAMLEKSITDRDAQMRQMQAWASDWYWWTIKPHVTDDVQPVMERLSSIQRDRFEREFLSEMIAHHRKGIAMAVEMAKASPHPEARMLALTIGNEQVSEANAMKGWLKQWYGVGSTPVGD